MVEINSGKGTVTRYAHNILNLVRTGDSVGQGDVIGMLGETGNAGSLPAPEAHSHFEVTVEGQRVDPAVWLNTAVTPP
jgi:murein DD-endopeptidase MepM/ murein hydrolase activator NlpD